MIKSLPLFSQDVVSLTAFPLFGCWQFVKLELKEEEEEEEELKEEEE